MTSRFALVLMAMMTAGISSAQFYGNYDELPEIGSRRLSVNSTNSQIRIDQKLNTVIPDDITFTESTGKQVTTGELFSDKPTILLMVFFECAGVCTTELNSLTDAVKGINKEDVGDMYNIVVVSIDHSEKADLAALKKQTYTGIYDRRGTDDGWRFVVGDEKNINALAKAVGFMFYRDPANGQITHPAGLMVVSPQRRLTRYFLDAKFDSMPLLLALEDAKVDKVGERDSVSSWINCINVDPLTGKRSLNIMKALRLGGILTLAGLLVSVVMMNRNNARKEVKKTNSANTEMTEE